MFAKSARLISIFLIVALQCWAASGQAQGGELHNKSTNKPAPLLSPLLLSAAKQAYKARHETYPSILPAAYVRQPASNGEEQKPGELPPTRVDPQLVGKKVLVHCRDARLYKGKLLELDADFIRVQIATGIEHLSLTDIALVERQPGLSKAWVAVAIASAAIVVGWVVVIAQAGETQ